MRRLIKAGIITAVTAVCLILLTGCGETVARYKIGKEARYYIANKYKFRPGTTDVELRHTGELEGVWHNKDAGTANMEYKGHTFKVYVSLTDPEVRYDDYLMEDVEEYLTDHFSTALDCSDIHVWATYGEPVCMIPEDVKTVEDVFEKCDNVQIYVSTFGLDEDSVKDLDVTGLGSDTNIDIIDWISEDCISDEDLMRETVVGLESDSYTDGYSKIMSHYHFGKGK